MVRQELPAGLTEPKKKFIEFVDTGAGAIDITQAELLVSIGRGVGEEENIAVIRELADLMGLPSPAPGPWWTRTGCRNSTR